MPTAFRALIQFSPIGTPPFSIRDATQQLEPIQQAGVIRYDVNGVPMDLTPRQFKKYRMTVDCEDMTSPAIDDILVGQVLIVDCAVELNFITEGGAPSRPVVDGSMRVEGLRTFYRPQLTVMVTNHTVSAREFQASVNWHMEATEM